MSTFRGTTPGRLKVLPATTLNGPLPTVTMIAGRQVAHIGDRKSGLAGRCRQVNAEIRIGRLTTILGGRLLTTM